MDDMVHLSTEAIWWVFVITGCTAAILVTYLYVAPRMARPGGIMIAAGLLIFACFTTAWTSNDSPLEANEIASATPCERAAVSKRLQSKAEPVSESDFYDVRELCWEENDAYYAKQRDADPAHSDSAKKAWAAQVAALASSASALPAQR